MIFLFGPPIFVITCLVLIFLLRSLGSRRPAPRLPQPQPEWRMPPGSDTHLYPFKLVDGAGKVHSEMQLMRCVAAEMNRRLGAEGSDFQWI